MPASRATHTISSPFTDPAFIAALKADDVRRTRLQRAITRDIHRLTAIAPAPTSLPPSADAQPRHLPAAPIVAYRVLVRVLTLAANCLTECHADALWRSFRRMVRRVERGEDRFIALRDHVGSAIGTTVVDEAARALPTIWHALANFIRHLVHGHWHALVQTAARSSTENRWDDHRLVLRNLRRLRRLTASPTTSATMA